MRGHGDSRNSVLAIEFGEIASQDYDIWFIQTATKIIVKVSVAYNSFSSHHITQFSGVEHGWKITLTMLCVNKLQIYLISTILFIKRKPIALLFWALWLLESMTLIELCGVMGRNVSSWQEGSWVKPTWDCSGTFMFFPGFPQSKNMQHRWLYIGVNVQMVVCLSVFGPLCWLQWALTPLWLHMQRQKTFEWL